MNYLLIISSIFILTSLIFLQKKLNFLLDSPDNSKHKKKIYSGIPLSGGLFFLIFIVIFRDILKIESSYLLLIIGMTILGLFSDIFKNFKPSQRLIIQFFLLIIFILFSNFKIQSSNLFFLDYFLNNNLFNLLFTTFCLSILINGSNFCDGVNINVSGYYLILLLGIYFISKDLGINFDIFIFIYPLIIFTIFNFLTLCFLGDNGSYFLSVLFGVFLIKVINSNVEISPFFAILALWYPCFENLFSIIRRTKKKFNSMKPDRNHLHHKLLNFLIIKFFLKNKKIANSLTGLLICAFNSFSMFLGYTFYNSSLILALIVIFNVMVYLIMFSLLKNEKY